MANFAVAWIKLTLLLMVDANYDTSKGEHNLSTVLVASDMYLALLYWLLHVKFRSNWLCLNIS